MRRALLLAALLVPAAFAPTRLPVAPPALAQVNCSSLPPGKLLISATTRSAVPRDPCDFATPLLGLGGKATAYWGLGDQFFGATANRDEQGSTTLTPIGAPRRASHPNRMPAAFFTAANNEYLSAADPWTSGDINFTVGCWVYLNSLTGNKAIASKDDGTQREWRLYYLDTTTDRYVFEIFSGAGASRGSVQFGTPVAGAWQFVVGAHNATTNLVKGSVNAAAYTTAATSNVAVDTDDPFELGRMAASTADDMDGRLSQCFFIKEELSAQDLTDLWNHNEPVPSREFSARVATVAEGLWDLNETGGNRAAFRGPTLTDNATVLHAAGLAPKAYEAGQLAEVSNQFWVGPSTALLTNPAITIFGWARADITDTASTVAKQSGSSSELAEFFVWRQTSDSKMRLFTGQGLTFGTCDVLSTGTTRVGDWIAYSTTIDTVARELTMQIDAEATRALKTGCTGFVTGGALRFGRQSDTVGTVNWNGQLAAHAIWFSKLTEANHVTLYAGGQGFSCETIPRQIPRPEICYDLFNPKNKGTLGPAWDLTPSATAPTRANGITSIPGGVTLHAAEFVRANSEYLSATSALNSGQVDASWGLWFRHTALNANSTLAALGNSTANADTAWRFVTENGVNGDIALYAYNGTALHIRRIAPLFRENLWSNIVVTLDGDAPATVAYADGVVATAAGSNAAPTAIISGQTTFNVGAMAATAGTFLDGHVGQLAIWNATLTAEQAALYYNSGDQIPCLSIGTVVGVTPSWCWDFNELSGTRSAAIGGVHLVDNATVTAKVGLIRGRTGHAARFNKTPNAYTTVIDPPAITSAGTFSISGWAFERDRNANEFLWGKRDATSSGFSILLQPNETFRSQILGTGNQVLDTFQIPDMGEPGRWFHIVQQYDTSLVALNHKIFVNGVLARENHFIGPIANSATADFSIGRPGELTTATFPHDDPMDEVMFSLKPLTEQQIRCLYNGGRGWSAEDLLAGACAE